MPSTAQLVCSLWTQTDEFIHIYSLSENFQAELLDCSVHQPKQDTHHLPYMPAGMHGSAVRRGGELYWGEAIAMLKKQAKWRTVEQEKGLDKQGTFVGQLSSKPGCFGDNLCFI